MSRRWLTSHSLSAACLFLYPFPNQHRLHPVPPLASCVAHPRRKAGQEGLMLLHRCTPLCAQMRMPPETRTLVMATTLRG